MSADKPLTRGILYLISCASSAAEYVPDFVKQAQAEGWDICMITTPQGRNFVDIPSLTELTGHPVRSDYKKPEEPDVLPRADAVVVFPATFNTLNKWALGITDTLALGILCEYTGLKKPILAVPGIHSASGLDTHPALQRSLRLLRKYGVHVLYEPDDHPPNNKIPATRILHVLDELVRSRFHCD